MAQISEAAPVRAGYRHDDQVVAATYAAIRKAGIDFAVHLPDTINYPLIRALDADPDVISINCSREDEAVAIAMGAYLGGHWPILLTEGSGLGLAGLALARAVVQRTPMLILASHNSALGERHDYGSATRRVTEPLLQALTIPYVVAMRGSDIPMLVREAQMTVQGDRRPVAILLPRHSMHELEEDRT
ncbi:thiamine pyrophosphate-binding protein [Rhizobium sp. BR 314]|uniref:thiamine pyrophosphate-binding protein n=1 Tax=Rhizobium sp. BR 314 TaxID=3040013 RepID=UPI0039BFFA78